MTISCLTVVRSKAWSSDFDSTLLRLRPLMKSSLSPWSLLRVKNVLFSFFQEVVRIRLAEHTSCNHFLNVLFGPRQDLARYLSGPDGLHQGTAHVVQGVLSQRDLSNALSEDCFLRLLEDLHTSECFL